MNTIHAFLPTATAAAVGRTDATKPAQTAARPARKFAALRALLAKWRWAAERPDRWVPYY